MKVHLFSGSEVFTLSRIHCIVIQIKVYRNFPVLDHLKEYLWCPRFLGWFTLLHTSDSVFNIPEKMAVFPLPTVLPAFFNCFDAHPCIS